MPASFINQDNPIIFTAAQTLWSQRWWCFLACGPRSHHQPLEFTALRGCLVCYLHLQVTALKPREAIRVRGQGNVIGKIQGQGSVRPECKFHFWYFLSMWAWANYLASSRLNFSLLRNGYPNKYLVWDGGDLCTVLNTQIALRIYRGRPRTYTSYFKSSPLSTGPVFP